MRFPRHTLTAALAALLVWCATASAAPITILSAGDTGVYARGTGAPPPEDFDELSPGNSAFDGVNLTATAGGQSSMNLSLTQTAASVAIGADVTMIFGGQTDARNDAFIGRGLPLRFTANGDAAFALSGSLSGSGSDSALLGLFVELFDITAGGTTLFLQISDALSQNPASLTVGTAAGDTIDVLEGATAGALVAGHTYGLTMIYNVLPSFSGTGTYFATGDFSFEVTAIPEAAALPLFVLALAGLARRRSRRRS
jgi:hypothetical protein